MTLNINEPTDQRMVSELPAYIRENRSEINSMLAGILDVSVNNLEVSAGATSFTIGTELESVGIEIIIISSNTSVDIANIYDGTEGQIKLFIFQDSNVDITDGNVKTGGAFYLNQLPAGSDFEPQQDDILVVVNIDGDGSSIDGYWKEIFRTLSVK